MKQLVFSEFVKECYEYGDKLADMKIRCVYFTSPAEHKGGYEHFSMKFGCTDGAYCNVHMDERKPEVFC